MASARVSERGARRRRTCQSAGRDGGASVGARGATAARVTERGARRRRECQSAGRDGRACVRARGATAVRKYSKCQPHANGRGSRARSKSKSKPSVARPSRGRRLKALVEAIATAVSPRPCGRRSARGRRATGGGRKYSKCQPHADGRRSCARSNLEIETVGRRARPMGASESPRRGDRNGGLALAVRSARGRRATCDGAKIFQVPAACKR